MASWETVIELGSQLPEVDAGTWFRTAALQVRGKSFVRLKEDGEHAVVYVDLIERGALNEEDPKTFVVTPHYENYPAMMVNLERVKREQLRELLIESWRHKAPKPLLRAYDEQNPVLGE